MQNTILELEKKERWSEAGYGKIFAFNKTRFNATIDVRTRAKFLRNTNPTYKETQEEILYSGPTIFFNHNIDIEGYNIAKLDIKSAYPSYLINEKIRKVGMFRMKYNFAVPISPFITLYTVRFNTLIQNPFVDWFLNSSAINKKKIKTDGKRVFGDVSIFSSIEMDLIKYVNLFLGDTATIVQSIVFFGDPVIQVAKLQIRKLYEQKEKGSKEAKLELTASTGWLALIDRPSYFHMVQYIKWFLLETIYTYGLMYDVIGSQTDSILYRLNERTLDAFKQMNYDKLTLSNERTSMGTYKLEVVKKDDLIITRKRVVKK